VLLGTEDRCFRIPRSKDPRQAARFMTITLECTEWMRQTCPAVVHVDGTARPQLVGQRDSPALHEILSRYREMTGIPCFANTSFNLHEEPIVTSPEDAIRAFVEAQLDVLAMGPFLVFR
jgi:carbamoyltransferase